MFEDTKEQLKIDEGFVDTVYTCPAGKLTIGYGFNIEDNPMPEHIASLWLDHEIMECHEHLSNYQWYCELNEARKGVIINMAFNLGVTGLLNFRNMIKAIEEKDYEGAADEMVDSRWYQQVGNRAVRLENMMRKGL